MSTSSSSSQPEIAPAEDILRDLIGTPESLRNNLVGRPHGKRQREDDPADAEPGVKARHAER